MARKRRPATRVDHEKFCATEGWTERKRATGKSGTHRVNYELALPDGRILYTRISHPVDRTDYGARMWAHILRDQLDITADEFWECVENKTPPERGQPQPEGEAIPVGVARTLIHEAHIPESEVRRMTKQEAIKCLAEFYSRPD